MANMRIQVIAPPANEFVSKGKNGYNKLTVTYKNLGTNKVEVKSIMDFASPDVYAKLKEVGANEVFQVTSEKQGEYWVWTEVSRDDGPVPEATATPASKSTPSAKAGSWDEKNALDREKFEFDKTKQTLIIRQSCLSSAVALAVSKDLYSDDALAIAAQFEEWVNRKDLGSLKEMQDDIPY